MIGIMYAEHRDTENQWWKSSVNPKKKNTQDSKRDSNINDCAKGELRNRKTTESLISERIAKEVFGKDVTMYSDPL